MNESGPDQQCEARRDGMSEGVTRQCRRRQWRGTDYCYQHAIANGEAVVITFTMLRVTMPDASVLDVLTTWRKLVDWRKK